MHVNATATGMQQACGASHPVTVASPENTFYEVELEIYRTLSTTSTFCCALYLGQPLGASHPVSICEVELEI